MWTGTRLGFAVTVRMKGGAAGVRAHTTRGLYNPGCDRQRSQLRDCDFIELSGAELKSGL